jgi:hypothetical protein
MHQNNEKKVLKELKENHLNNTGDYIASFNISSRNSD